jgi:hypothetical protein
VLGDQAALGEGGGEHRRFGGEAQVGIERDDEAQPGGRPLIAAMMNFGIAGKYE